MKVPTKILYLVECGINALMTTANKYIVAACADGAVRFYDYYLRLEAWFEDLNAGPVSSISFSVQPNPFPASEAGSPGLKFWVPDFIVGTSHAFMVGIESIMFNEVKKEDRRGTLLMQGMTDKVIAVACHPSQSLVAIVCSNGVLQLWNYDMKLLMVLREFNSSDIENSKTGKTSGNFKPNCIAFDSTGLLAIGFSSGVIKLLVSDSLEDIAHYTPSTDSIQHLQFSPTGDYLAAIDNSNHVLIFKRYVLWYNRTT
jgi:WD40 repeat protein